MSTGSKTHRHITITGVVYTAGHRPTDPDPIGYRRGGLGTGERVPLHDVLRQLQHPTGDAEATRYLEGRNPYVFVIRRRLDVGQHVVVDAYGRARPGVITGFGRTRVVVSFQRNAAGGRDERSFQPHEVHLPADETAELIAQARAEQAAQLEARTVELDRAARTARDGSPITCRHAGHYEADGLPTCRGDECRGETVGCGQGGIGCERHADRRHAGHDPHHMDTDTCEHGQLLWQGCTACRVSRCPSIPTAPRRGHDPITCTLGGCPSCDPQLIACQSCGAEPGELCRYGCIGQLVNGRPARHGVTLNAQGHVVESFEDGGRLVGRLVHSADDDSPCPVVGRISAQLDEDRVIVLWGDARFAEPVPCDGMPYGQPEYLDQLRPARGGA